MSLFCLLFRICLIGSDTNKLRECSKEPAISPTLPRHVMTGLSTDKAAATWMGGAYEGVPDHGQRARTPLAAISNATLMGGGPWVQTTPESYSNPDPRDKTNNCHRDAASRVSQS